MRGPRALALWGSPESAVLADRTGGGTTRPLRSRRAGRRCCHLIAERLAALYDCEGLGTPFSFDAGRPCCGRCDEACYQRGVPSCLSTHSSRRKSSYCQTATGPVWRGGCWCVGGRPQLAREARPGLCCFFSSLMGIMILELFGGCWRDMKSRLSRRVQNRYRTSGAVASRWIIATCVVAVAE